MRSHREPAAPPRGQVPLLHALASLRLVFGSEQDPRCELPAGAGGGEAPGWRELFSPEQILGGGSGGGRGPISGLFPSWAAALRFVRSHSPAMTEESFF